MTPAELDAIEARFVATMPDRSVCGWGWSSNDPAVVAERLRREEAFRDSARDVPALLAALRERQPDVRERAARPLTIASVQAMAEAAGEANDRHEEASRLTGSAQGDVARSDLADDVPGLACAVEQLAAALLPFLRAEGAELAVLKHERVRELDAP